MPSKDEPIGARLTETLILEKRIGPTESCARTRDAVIHGNYTVAQQFKAKLFYIFSKHLLEACYHACSLLSAAFFEESLEFIRTVHLFNILSGGIFFE